MAKEGFIIKDSGKRQAYKSGMVRDVQDDKPDFSLILADIPYEEQMLTRFAEHMTKGAKKYGRRNWQLANSTEEMERFRASAFRHFMQWFHGILDEDHAAAVYYNIMAFEATKYKLEKGKA